MDEGCLLILGNFLSAMSGSRGVCEDFAERLSKKGWRVLTASSYPGRLKRLGDMLMTIWRRRDQYQLATIDTYSGLAFIWAEVTAFALRRLGKPYILILHGGNLPEFSQRRPNRVRRLLRSAAFVTAPSRFLQEQMQVYRDDIRFVPNPIEVGRYPFRNRKNPCPRLIWLRAFHQVYNPTLCLRVFQKVIQNYPEAHLTMVGPDKGDGSLRAAQELARQLSIMDQVTWAGSVPNPDVPKWLSQADIFLNTTYVDNTPISVMEAMACGLCVVSTDVGGIPYLLEDGVDSLLVPPGDVEAMTLAVKRILDEPGLAETISNHAHQKMEQYDWSMVLPDWEVLFAEAITKGQTSAKP